MPHRPLGSFSPIHTKPPTVDPKPQTLSPKPHNQVDAQRAGLRREAHRGQAVASALTGVAPEQTSLHKITTKDVSQILKLPDWYAGIGKEKGERGFASAAVFLEVSVPRRLPLGPQCSSSRALNTRH